MQNKLVNEDINVNKKNSRKIIKILLIILVCFIFIGLYSRFVATKGLVVKEYKIVNSKFTDNFYGLKVIHISDIHYGMTTDKKELNKIINEVNLLKPDIIVITGDLYSLELSDEQINELKDFLNNLDANISKYAIKGNHDNDDLWNNIIEDTDFIDLNNNYDLIYNNNYESILIAGINTEDDINNSFEKIDEYLNNNVEDSEHKNNNIVYKILLMHKPDTILNFDYNRYNLILAGHSHNGQVRIPFVGAIYTPKGSKTYYDEHYNLGNTDLYISSGVGTFEVKLRLFNKPSINLYRFVNE